jgi:UDP:flavonoid glycosyltransferase YjiC (YdhE family)
VKIGITAFGTRGDTYPALALAKVVKQLGHHPVIVANTNTIPFIRVNGFDVRETKVDMMNVLDSELGHIW